MLYIAGANESLTKDVNLEINFMEVGFNTGNMAIARGVKDIIEKYFQQIPVRYNSSCDISASDVLVIGAANWISKTVELNWLFEPGIERFQKILVLGLGVQNKIDSIEMLSDSCQKFLRWLIEKEAVICTRDKISKNILSKYSERVFWTGCPSLRIKKPNLNNLSRSGISYGGSLEVLAHANNIDDLRAFEKIAIQEISKNIEFNNYILQAEFPLFNAIKSVDDKLFKDYVFSRVNITIEDLAIEKFKFYFDLDDWINDLSKNKFFIGTRLHGNILSWIAGVKGFLIAHDARTKSFIEDFKFPGIYLEGPQNFSDLIIKTIEHDYSEFELIVYETGEVLSKAINLID